MVGAGAIISADGYIVTNYHVIRGNETINVTLSDKRVFTAALIGADTSLDMALIRIDASDLPFLRFADSDSIQLGENVIAVGNPYRLQFTITSGIVSARERPSMMEVNSSPYFIQTDVPINNGNSGGPLLNAMGELIGINLGHVSNTGAYEGFTLSIPGNIIKYVTDQLLNYNVSRKGSLGISIRSVTKDDAAAVGMQTLDGVVVDAVTSEGAADVGGLQSLDIITDYNGKPVLGKKDFQERLVMTKPGDVITLAVNRNGKKMEIKVTLQ
jgi:S1-C subfamily serine protease